MCYTIDEAVSASRGHEAPAAAADDLVGQRRAEGIMQWTPSRRRVLAALSSATAAGLAGGARGMAQEAPPETTTIRLGKIPGICIAPQYVAEELLRSEGFTSVQYVELSVNVYAGFTAGTIDISMAFIAPYIIQMDEGLPLMLVGGADGGRLE